MPTPVTTSVNTTATTTADIDRARHHRRDHRDDEQGCTTVTRRRISTSRTLTGAIGGDDVSRSAARQRSQTRTRAPARRVDVDGSRSERRHRRRQLHGQYRSSTTTATSTALGITGAITAANKAVRRRYDGRNDHQPHADRCDRRRRRDLCRRHGRRSPTGTRQLARRSTATGLGLSGADAGNYVVNTTATTTAVDYAGAADDCGASTQRQDLRRHGHGGATPTVTGLVGGDTVERSAAKPTPTRTPAPARRCRSRATRSTTATAATTTRVALVDDLTGVIDPAALVGSILAGESGRTTARPRRRSPAVRSAAWWQVTRSATSAASATFADKNAGIGKTVTATGLGLGGADAVQLHGQLDRDDRGGHSSRSG